MHFQLFFLCTHTHTHSYSRQYLFRFDGFLGKQNCNQHPFIDLSDKINMNFRSELFLSSSFFYSKSTDSCELFIFDGTEFVPQSLSSHFSFENKHFKYIAFCQHIKMLFIQFFMRIPAKLSI